MADQLTFKLQAHQRPGEVHLEATAGVATRAQAQEIAKLFPKTTRVKATTLSGDLDDSLQNDDSAPYRIIGYLHFYVEFTSNAVTGGFNETGLRRYRSFRRALGRLGYSAEWTAPYGNSVQTEADFERYLQGGDR